MTKRKRNNKRIAVGAIIYSSSILFIVIGAILMSMHRSYGEIILWMAIPVILIGWSIATS